MLNPRSLYILITILLLNFSYSSFAQEELNLDQCIDIALKNNYQIKRAENNVLIAKSNKIQALMAYLPNVNARANYDFTFGSLFDQNSGDFVNTTTRSSSPVISSSFTVFDGFRNTSQLKRNKAEEESSKHALSSARLDTKSNVLEAYLSVVLDRERIKISNERIQLLNKQLDRAIKRESVGVGNLEMVYSFKSQVANENLNLVNLTNTFKSDKLRLVQLLSLKEDKDYRIKQYELEEEVLYEVKPFNEILNTALGFSPSLKSANENLKASKYSMKEAYSSLYPTLTVSGGIGSRFSSNRIDPVTEQTVAFSTQLSDNQFEFIGITLDIPIFNRFRARNGVQVAKLNFINADYTRNETEQTIRNNIQRVYLDLISAQETYKAAEENLVALDQSFQFVKKRYDTGNTDFYTYLESLNNKSRAEIELANAKYSIIFRKKILNLLQGV